MPHPHSSNDKQTHACVSVLTADEKGKLLALRKTQGYLQQLGPRVAAVSRSPTHLSRLVQALLQVSKWVDILRGRVVMQCLVLQR